MLKRIKIFLFLVGFLLASLGGASRAFASPGFSLAAGYQANYFFGFLDDNKHSYWGPGGIFVEPTLHLAPRHKIKFPLTWVYIEEGDYHHQFSFAAQYGFHFIDSENLVWDPYVNAGLGITRARTAPAYDGTVVTYPFIELGIGLNYWFTPRIALNLQASFRTIIAANQVPLRLGVHFKF